MLSHDILLRLKDVTKVIGKRKRRPLRKVNLDITSGEFISIVYKDGDDRDIIFGIMGLLDAPTSGVIFLKQREVSGLSEDLLTRLRLKHIGLVFKDNIFVDELSIKENIEILLKEAGVPNKDLEKRVFAALELVDLQDKADFKPTELSKFEVKAASIARALANRPAILLVNEPPPEVNGRGMSTIDLLKELKGKTDITVVFMTTSQRLGDKAEKVYRLKDGKLENKVIDPKK